MKYGLESNRIRLLFMKLHKLAGNLLYSYGELEVVSK